MFIKKDLIPEEFKDRPNINLINYLIERIN